MNVSLIPSISDQLLALGEPAGPSARLAAAMKLLPSLSDQVLASATVAARTGRSAAVYDPDQSIRGHLERGAGEAELNLLLRPDGRTLAATPGRPAGHNGGGGGDHPGSADGEEEEGDYEEEDDGDEEGDEFDYDYGEYDV
jgi:hypothetical protein